MKLTIHLDSKIPLYAQLVDNIKQLVADGHLMPETPLPSIRQLATDLEINKKTVAKAYQLLERDNVIISKGYRGSFIHQDAKKNAAINLIQQAETELAMSLDKLKEMGLTKSEIRNLFHQLMMDEK